MKKQTARYAILIVLMVSFFWSCEKTLEESPLQEVAITDVTLQEAQDFYNEIQEKELAVSRASKNDKRTKKVSRKAFWDRTEKFKAGTQEVMTAPILFDDDLNLPGFGFKKMLFYKDTRTGKTDARIIEYVLDKEYLSNNFGKTSLKTYEGLMVVYDAEGNYMDGIAVKAGKPTNRVGVGLDGEIMQAKKPNGKEAYTITGCVASWNAYGCGGQITTLESALANCSAVYVQYLNCGDNGGGTSPSAGVPSNAPPASSTTWGTFSGYADGGGGVYQGAQTAVSIEQSLFNEFPPENNFKLSASDIVKYPKYADFIRNLKPFVLNNPKILAALKEWTAFSETRLTNELTFNKGPQIVIDNFSTSSIPDLYRNRFIAAAVFIRSTQSLGVEESYVKKYETGQFTYEEKEAFALYLAVQILHEYVHFGAWTHHVILDTSWNGKQDFGYGFEMQAFGKIIYTARDAKTVLDQLTFKVK